MPFTESQLKARKPGARVEKMFDGGGLFLEVSPTGRKTFRLNYRFEGRMRTKSLGLYPEVKLADARIAREQVKALLRSGVDPEAGALVKRAAAKREEPKIARAGMWEKLAADYIEFRRRDGAHWKTMTKLERQVGVTLPKLGKKHVSEITATDILDAVRPIENAGRIETAHETRSRCSQIFEFAEAKGFPNTNPAKVSRGAMIKRRPGSLSGLTDPKEIGGLIRAIRGYSEGEPQIRAALLLSAYLFPRNTELRGMLWSEIDWTAAVWEVPGSRMKMGRDHVIPLPRQAVKVLKDIQAWTGRSLYVIPAPRNFSKIVIEATFNRALLRMGYSADRHVHHGFRTSASTSLNELGFNRDWIERQLAHVEGNKVRGTYNKAQYLDGRTTMMQAYADWLDAQADKPA